GSVTLGTADDLGDVTKNGNAAIWDTEADVYFFSAKEYTLTAEVARKLKPGSIVIELANMAVHPDADAILAERGITVVPDALANAGGVTGSYIEWIQNKTGDKYTLETVQEEIIATLLKSYKHILDVSRRDPGQIMTLRQATLVLALERLYDAEIARNPKLKLPDHSGPGGSSSGGLTQAGSPGPADPAGSGAAALARAGGALTRGTSRATKPATCQSRRRPLGVAALFGASPLQTHRGVQARGRTARASGRFMGAH
ncbi:MAG: hypothetical protein Q7T11_06080, partial [Deltaproteobacteria bacterium]|nr:hypothetical protein [Deltaproteobacteria bacterium]